MDIPRAETALPNEGKVTQINLHKRISTGSVSLDNMSAVDRNRMYIGFGNFQLMEVIDHSESLDFSTILNYPATRTIGNVRYAVYPIFFYDAHNYNEVPFPQEYLEEQYFVVGGLMLNKTPELTKQYPNAKKMLKSVKKMIETRIENKDSFKGLNYKIYPCYGAFDLLVIAHGNNLDVLMDLWPELRKLPHKNQPDCHRGCEEKEKCDGKKTRSFLFKASSSFLAVHNSFNLSHAKAKKVPYVGINHFVMNLNDCSALHAAYSWCATNPDKPPAIRYIQGQYDVAVDIRDCAFDRLMYIFGARYGKTRDYNEHKSYKDEILGFEKCFGNNIENIQLILEFGGRPEGRDETCEQLARNTEKIWEKMKEIRILGEGIRKYLPTSAHRTMDFVVDKCLTMLSFDQKQRTMTGHRTYVLVRKAFKMIESSIKRGSSGFGGKDITKCLGNVSLSMNTLLTAEGFRPDDFGDLDIDSINPGSKIYYAIEHIIRTIFKAVEKERAKEDSYPVWFLTVNPLDMLESTLYLSGTAENDPNVTIDDTSDRLYSVNLPNVEFFSPSRILPYLCHEIAHYVHLGDVEVDKESNKEDSRIIRHKTIYNLVKRYIVAYVQDYVFPFRTDTEEKSYDSEADLLKDYSLLMKSLMNAVEMKFEFSQSTGLFKQICIGYTGRLLSHAEHVCDEEWSNLTHNQQLFFTKLCAGVKAVHTSLWKIIDILTTAVVVEAKADIIMTCVCDYDFREYLGAHFRFMRDANIPISSCNDMAHIMRVAAVLSVLAEKNGGIEQVKVFRDEPDQLAEEERSFLSEVLSFYDHNNALLPELINYLKIVENNVNKRLAEKMSKYSGDKEYAVLLSEVLNVIRMPITQEKVKYTEKKVNDIKKDIKKAVSSPGIIHLMEFFYNMWYDSLAYWGRREEHGC